jgi:hypothetical protein
MGYAFYSKLAFEILKYVLAGAAVAAVILVIKIKLTRRK